MRCVKCREQTVQEQSDQSSKFLTKPAHQNIYAEYGNIFQIIQYKNRRDEAFLTVDAYRKAFEEQLERSKSLTIQLASLTTSSPSRTSKTKQALRWLIGSINEDGKIFTTFCNWFSQVMCVGLNVV